jgi:ribonuclease HII
MKCPTYEIEDRIKGKGFKYVVGVDEAGRGALNSVVVAAAVRIPDFAMPKFVGKIKDSKQLSEKKREELYEDIAYSCDFGIGMVDNEVIDEINILQATKMAMKAAVNKTEACDYVIVDGNFTIPGLKTAQRCVVGGDRISISVAAASIVAKVTRDRIIYKLHEQFPMYSWDKNKGYGTKEHMDAIKKYGPCVYHRKSFSGVLDV